MALAEAAEQKAHLNSILRSPGICPEAFMTTMGFDFEAAMDSIHGPIVEVGGPTPRGYRVGRQVIHLNGLHKDVIITNISPTLVLNKDEQLIFSHVVDKVADARDLPFINGSVGALFASFIPFEIREETLLEAARVVERNGLMVLQGGRWDDSQRAARVGLQTREAWRQPRERGKVEMFQFVFQRN